MSQIKYSTNYIDGYNEKQIRIIFDYNSEGSDPKIIVKVGRGVSKETINEMVERLMQAKACTTQSVQITQPVQITQLVQTKACTVQPTQTHADFSLRACTRDLSKYIKNTREYASRCPHPDFHCTTLKGRKNIINFIQSVNQQMIFTEEEIDQICASLN